MNDILDGYAAAATPELIERYEAFDPAALYAPVLDLLPQTPGRVADIGTGTGRDAAWFAGQGHRVLAVEPVRALREAGMARHGDKGLTWLNDTLPELAATRQHGPFDLVTLNGVWQHIDDAARAIALPVLAGMLAPGGRLVLALRHGAGAAGRPAFPICDDDTIAAAAGCGLALLRCREAGSHQAANRALGVRWTWMVFERPSA
ncbi:MAG: class I SAM-dependent methyltransferase [Shinella sp.]|uniref:class I SAM-dependent methyltransferase n=1 Tax=Shinella sp. TaxID=1870904 RepID=UPI0040368833